MKPIDELLDLHAATYPTTKEARQIANSERWQPIRGRGSTLGSHKMQMPTSRQDCGFRKGIGKSINDLIF